MADEKITLATLAPAPGSHRDRRRLGRGPGSGLGKTSGKGHKGSMARTGHGGPGGGKPGFEGGQMPLARRIPKRGFTQATHVTYQVVGLDDLARVAGDEVTPDTLHAAGLARKTRPIKLLANGAPARAFTVKGVKASQAARARIVAAGGSVQD